MSKPSAASKLNLEPHLERFVHREQRRYERELEKRPNAHFRFENITLHDQFGKKIEWEVLGSAVTAIMEWTITGASTLRLEIEDPKQDFLNHPVFHGWMFKKISTALSSNKTFKARKISSSHNNARYGEESYEQWVLPQRPIDMNCDGIWLRMTGFMVQETRLTLIFEDRVAAILREQVGSAISVNRGSMTRAGFINHLCNIGEHSKINRAKIKRFIPEAKIKQPIVSVVTEGQSSGDLKRGSNREITLNDNLTAGSTPLNASQVTIINQMLEAAVEAKAPARAQVAMMISGIAESRFSPTSNNGTYAGVLAGAVSRFPNFANETLKQVHFYLYGGEGYQGGGAIEYAKAHPKASCMQIAETVAGVTAEHQYQKEIGASAFEHEADQIVKVYGGKEGETGGTKITVPGPYAFTRGEQETSWDCIQRLASEVSWYAFVRENVLWYVSGNYLLAQASRMDVEKGLKGVDWVNPHVEIGARDKAAEIEVLGRALPFTAVPGEAVSVKRVGPCNGTWVVENITMDVLDRSDKITCKLTKPLPARPEPAAPTTEEKEIGPSSNNGTSPAPGATWGRLDMGFDGNYGVAGPVAPYDGTIHIPNIGGWPGEGVYFYIVNNKQSGPDYTRAMYFAEGATPIVKDGEKVTAGTPLGKRVFHGGDGSLGNFEIGPAKTDNGDCLAKAYGLNTPGAKKMVLAFAKWMESIGAGKPTNTTAAGGP